jgi:hypothetical protein
VRRNAPRRPLGQQYKSLIYGHTSDFVLVRLYHPDVCKARGLDPSLAESRFQAVTGAYNALRSGLGGSASSPSSVGGIDGEAEEIRNRLATWRSREQNRGSLEWMRRQRALRAEADAGKWWKSDRMLVYSLAGVVSHVATMGIRLKSLNPQTLVVGAIHFSVRSPVQRSEQAKRYIELKTRQAQERRLRRESDVLSEGNSAGSSEVI